MGARVQVDVPKSEITALCRRHHIRKLALFGSVLRDYFRPDSDVDVVVNFEPGFVPGLSFFVLEEELTEIFGRKVELFTPAFLSRYFRDSVLAEAEVLYSRSA